MTNYPTYKELRLIVARQYAAFQMMDSSLLTMEGRVTREMWRRIAEAFYHAACLDDALTNISCIMDDMLEKASLTFYNARQIRAVVMDMRQWVIANVPRDVWSQYPMIVNPDAA